MIESGSRRTKLGESAAPVADHAVDYRDIDLVIKVRVMPQRGIGWGVAVAPGQLPALQYATPGPMG